MRADMRVRSERPSRRIDALRFRSGEPSAQCPQQQNREACYDHKQAEAHAEDVLDCSARPLLSRSVIKVLFVEHNFAERTATDQWERRQIPSRWLQQDLGDERRGASKPSKRTQQSLFILRLLLAT